MVRFQCLPFVYPMSYEVKEETYQFVGFGMSFLGNERVVGVREKLSFLSLAHTFFSYKSPWFNETMIT